MIVSIQRKKLALFMLFSFLGVAGTALYIYFSPPLPEALRKLLGSEGEIRYHREHALFIGIAALVLMLPAGLGLIRDSRNLSRELRLITSMIHSRDVSPEQRLRRMGETGRLISELYHEINRISTQKSLKIQAQTNLAHYLVEQIGKLLAVTLHTGELVHASAELKKTWGITASAPVSGPIESRIPGIEVQEMLQKLSLHREDTVFTLTVAGNTKEEEKNGKKPIPAYLHPILNSDQEIAYAVWLFDETPPIKEMSTVKPDTQKPEKARPFLSRFFRRTERPEQ